MKNIKAFKDFILNESTAAGNREETFDLPFAYSSNDPKHGYSSKSFVKDLKSIFVEKPEIKGEIIEFLLEVIGVSRIEDLETKPLSLIMKIIPEIERIIDSGEYKPEYTMPGGALLFIRDKKFKEGGSADFYINRKGTKIEVVTEDESGDEKTVQYSAEKFPYDKFEFTEEEKEELMQMVRAKNSD